MEMQLNAPGPWAAALGVAALGLLLTRWIGGRTRVAWNAALSTLHGDRA